MHTRQYPSNTTLDKLQTCYLDSCYNPAYARFRWIDARFTLDRVDNVREYYNNQFDIFSRF